MFIVATTNTRFVGDRAKVELLWLKNWEQGILGPKSLGSGLLVHMVGHIKKQCGHLTDEEARLFSAWCATHEEKNTMKVMLPLSLPSLSFLHLQSFYKLTFVVYPLFLLPLFLKVSC